MNPINSRTTRPRRSAEQWQALINEWQAGSISAKQFCTEHAIGYASFCQWRKRLSAPRKDILQEQKAEPGFIDLAALASSAPTGWNVTAHSTTSLPQP